MTKYRVTKETLCENTKPHFYPQTFDVECERWEYFVNEKPSKKEKFDDWGSSEEDGLFFIKFETKEQAIGFCVNDKRKRNLEENVVWED